MNAQTGTAPQAAGYTPGAIPHLRADEAQIRQFVDSLFRYYDAGTYISLRAFDQHKKNQPPVIRSVKLEAGGLDNLVAAAVVAAEKSANAPRGEVFAPPICAFSDSYRARGVDLANGFALSVEVDEAPVAGRRYLEQIIGPTTVTVESGSTWADPETGELQPKVHLHWRLSEPTRDQEDHGRLRDARSIAMRLIGADPTGVPVVHPLRWPGSWNVKGKPVLARIVAGEETEIHLADALDKLQEALEQAGFVAAGVPQSSKPTADPVSLTAAMAAIPNGGSVVHYGDWVKLGYACWRAFGGDAGFDAWDCWSRKSDKYDAGETEAAWKRIGAACSGTNPPRIAGAGTIFFLAKSEGWHRPSTNEPPPLTDEEIAQAQDGHWDYVKGDDGQNWDRPRYEEPNPAEARPHHDKPLLEVLTPSQIKDEQARAYIVKGLIARGDHAINMGHPGSGKSVLAPHVAYAVAQGINVLGRRVKGGPVVYIASEDGHGMKNRVRALLRRYGDAPDFHLVPVSVDLMTNGPSRKAVDDLVRRVSPVLIVIDVLNKSFPGLRENEGEDMGKLVRVVRELTDICGSAVWSVHHVAKDAGTTPRGHGSLAGDADITLLIEGTGSETRRVKLGKNRNGPSDITLAFDIAIEELGIDDDGDPITAPVLVEVDAATLRPEPDAKLSDKNAVLLREARSAIAEHGTLVQPAPDMPPVRAVSRDLLRTRLIAAGWFPDNMVVTAPQCAPKLTRQGHGPLSHALTTLKRKNLLYSNLAWAWVI